MKKNMTIQEMWHYIIFQTKGYRTIKAAIVIGALTAAAVPYVNNIFYAGILDRLVEGGQYRVGGSLAQTTGRVLLNVVAEFLQLV